LSNVLKLNKKKPKHFTLSFLKKAKESLSEEVNNVNLTFLTFQYQEFILLLLTNKIIFTFMIKTVNLGL